MSHSPQLQFWGLFNDEPCLLAMAMRGVNVFDPNLPDEWLVRAKPRAGLFLEAKENAVIGQPNKFRSLTIDGKSQVLIELDLGSQIIDE